MEFGNLTESFDDWLLQNEYLENFDFDTFLNGESSSPVSSWFLEEQSQANSPPTGNKRPSNGITQKSQSPIKRMKIQHSHVCDIHPPPNSKPLIRCFGKTLRKGLKGKKCERLVASFVDGHLPVCAQHKSQNLRMVRCEANLECGMPCNEILPWEPHQYLLCEAHVGKGRCFLMELPVEIRLSIYGYLITNLPVPARSYGTRGCRHGRNSGIFRVNKTIHEEVADLLYGRLKFHIDVTNEDDGITTTTPAIFMCYAKQANARPPARRFTHSRSSSQSIPASGFKDLLAPWYPMLPPRYFQRIRHLQINIKFAISQTYPSTSSRTQTAETILAEAERDLLCDSLHRLVERLTGSDQATLLNLDIGFNIRRISSYEDFEANPKAIAHCEALMNPIRRLRSRNTKLASIYRMGPYYGQETNMLTGDLEEDDWTTTRLQSWCAEMTSPIKAPSKSPVLEQFARLAELLSQMSQHPFWRDTDEEEMMILLGNGRSAREANDMKAMGLVFRDVFNKLNQYHAHHLRFMQRMKQSCEIALFKGK